MAQFFREALIGNSFAIRLARMQPQISSEKYAQTVKADLLRTYTDHSAYNNRREVAQVLNQFAALHSIGYAQGMNFLAVGLFHLYREDCKKYAVQDTVYSLPRLLKICLPIYPYNRDDRGPLRFVRAVTTCIGHFFPEWNEDMFAYCEIFILHFWPALFGNLFSLDDSILVWQYFMSADSDRDRYCRLFAFTLALLRSKEKLFSLPPPHAFAILSDANVHKVKKLITRAQEHDTGDSSFFPETT